MNAPTGTSAYRSFIETADPADTPDRALNLIFGEDYSHQLDKKLSSDRGVTAG